MTKGFVRFIRKRNRIIRNKRSGEILQFVLSVSAILISIFAAYLSYQSNKTSEYHFEISNKPLLQVEFDPLSVSTVNDWPSELKYKIKNLGKYPIKILFGFTKYSIEQAPITKDLPFFKSNMVKRDLYVFDETPIYHQEVKELHDDKNAESFTGMLSSARQILYMYGKYSYVDLATNKQYDYCFIVRIYKDKWIFEYNENNLSNG